MRSTPNMTTAEQNKMFISQPTFHGIVMTGKYVTMPVCFNCAIYIYIHTANVTYLVFYDSKHIRVFV